MKTEYRSKLPHIVPIGAIEFITFNLWDAIPKHIILSLKEEYEQKVALLDEQLKNLNIPRDHIKDLKINRLIEARREYAEKVDHYADQNKKNSNFLKIPKIALIVENAIKELDGKYYDLLAYCIMPNHVHLLIDLSVQIPETYNGVDVPKDYYPLHRIMKKIKGSTARFANDVLGRTGTFWMKDSYDHYVRNERELKNIVRYILNNPVKAGLCNNPEDWRFSYCKY